MANDITNSLKSVMKEKVAELETLQATGMELLGEMEAAKTSDDAGRISELSEKFDSVGADIKSKQEEIETVQEQLGLFKTYEISDDEQVKSLDEEKRDKMNELFGEMKNRIDAGESTKSVGEMYADLLSYRKIYTFNDYQDRKGETELIAHFGKNAKSVDASKSIKSIYSNNGTVLQDEGNDVPGFVGTECGLVRDPNIYCLLDPPADDFEECLTTVAFNGNRLKYHYEAARENGATSVLETVYGYPGHELVQDGTKPESIFTIGTAEESVKKIATWIEASDEVLADCAWVANMIDHVLTSNVNEEKRRQLIVGNGTDEMRGIVNQPNILTRTHQDAGDGGDSKDNIYDTFRRALTDIWLQGGDTNNVCAILNPRDLEMIDLAKDNDGRYLFNDAECFTRMLRCLRLRAAVDMPQGTAVLGNFTNNWRFYLRQSLRISTGLVDKQFIQNLVTILAELRGMSVLHCPRKVVKVDGLSEVASS